MSYQSIFRILFFRDGPEKERQGATSTAISRLHTQLTRILELADADHTHIITSIITSLPKTSKYIQLSGGASVSTARNGLGQRTLKVWSDIMDLSEITTFDHSHWHAVTDQLVLSESRQHEIRTAVVVPPGVYGTGQGEIRRTSLALPYYVAAVNTRRRGFTVGEGMNVNSIIHVRDLATAFILLVEEAIDGGEKRIGERRVGIMLRVGSLYLLRLQRP